MRKLLALTAALMMVASSSFAALTLNWSYTGNYATFDAAVQAGWVVQMYADVSANTVLSGITQYTNVGAPTGGNSSDDLLLASFTTTLSKPKTAYNWAVNAMDASSIAGYSVYTVVFNATSIAAATQAVVVDSTAFVLPASGATS